MVTFFLKIISINSNIYLIQLTYIYLALGLANQADPTNNSGCVRDDFYRNAPRNSSMGAGSRQQGERERWEGGGGETGSLNGAGMSK